MLINSGEYLTTLQQYLQVLWIMWNGAAAAALKLNYKHWKFSNSMHKYGKTYTFMLLNSCTVFTPQGFHSRNFFFQEFPELLHIHPTIPYKSATKLKNKQSKI